MSRVEGSTKNRALSRYAREALKLLGQLIRIRRLERKLRVADLAKRVGISRDMMQRIERGDPRCGIGAVFEAATIVGVPLFDLDINQLNSHVKDQNDKLTLMPKAVRKAPIVINDDF